LLLVRRHPTNELRRKRVLGQKGHRIRYSVSEEFEPIGEQSHRITGIPRLPFPHHVNHFDPRLSLRWQSI